MQSLYTMCGSGSPGTKHGYAIHMYAATASMQDCCLANADGDFCIVPQENALHITTEVGLLKVVPGELVVIPRGLRFSVGLEADRARGYILEVRRLCCVVVCCAESTSPKLITWHQT